MAGDGFHDLRTALANSHTLTAGFLSDRELALPMPAWHVGGWEGENESGRSRRRGSARGQSAEWHLKVGDNIWAPRRLFTASDLLYGRSHSRQ